MSTKKKRFADDGWAVWVDGEDTSTVYINDWLNPKGNSYVDLAVRIRQVKVSTCLYIYVPFLIQENEIEDITLQFNNKQILQAIFSSACIIDYQKNKHTSEIAYNGKTIDIVHVSTMEVNFKNFAKGTLISVDLHDLQNYLDNDEAYFMWRMPHKSLDEIFRPHVDMGNAMKRLRDLITTPVISEKFGYSVRINESRQLPEEINRIGAFHRQKLKKAVVTLSIDENYELNDSGCYRIRRLEENLYRDYLPTDYKCEDVITYEWNQSREYNLQGQFNFYYNISRNSISQSSMILYMILLLAVGIFGNLLYDIIQTFINLL